MDERTVPLYQHVLKPLNKDVIIGSKLVAPNVRLIIGGSPRNAVVDSYNVGWDRMLGLYAHNNPGRDTQLDDVIEGFSCVVKGRGALMKHSFTKIEGDEQERLVRLMFSRPSLREKLCYSMRSFVADYDTFDLGKYLTLLNMPFGDLDRESRFVGGIGHTDAAKMRLEHIGELRDF